MTQKLPHPSIDRNDPWADDILGRKKFGQMLADMIQGISQPFVMSVKGEWGSGKSVFMRRLEAELEGRAPHIPVVFVDAWKYDYYEDPLYALVSAVEQRLAEENENDAAATGRKLFGAAGKVVAPLAKIAGAAIDMATGGAVATLVEGAGELGDAIFKANQGKRDAHGELRRELANARDSLLDRSKKEIKKRQAEKKVVVIIDELDRCRPDYAIRLLERVKHFFDMPGYLFVVAVDGQNLHEAVRTLYGAHVDGEKYLRKFFDLETYLPAPSTQNFNKLLRQSFAVFDGLQASEDTWKQVAEGSMRQGSVVPGDQRKVALLEASAFFEAFSVALDLRLRDQAQAYSRLHATVMALGDAPGFFPVAAALIVCLRYFDHEVYERWRVSGEVPITSEHQGKGQFFGLISSRAVPAAAAVSDYLKFASFTEEARLSHHLDSLYRTGQGASPVIVDRMQSSNRSWVSALKRSYENVFAISRILEDERS
jgi:hypothetical protein